MRGQAWKAERNVDSPLLFSYTERFCSLTAKHSREGRSEMMLAHPTDALFIQVISEKKKFPKSERSTSIPERRTEGDR